MMDSEFMTLLKDLEKEKGISYEALIEAIEMALVSAYKKSFSSQQDVVVKIDRQTAEMKAYIRRTVVEEVAYPETEISLEDAKNMDESLEVGGFVDEETMPPTFGRIAAQTARQVVIQRIREAERDAIYSQFSDKIGDIVSGVVQRFERKNIMLEIGKLEAILAPNEQVPGETFNQGERIKVYVVDVSKTTKGPQVVISRTHPGMVRRLFELEVPEIQNGTVEIKSVAREAGFRTKIAVVANDANVDPIGSCVGAKGSRVQNVVDVLGEKVDIVQYCDDTAEYIAEALKPAKVTNVMVDEEEQICQVVVPDNQLSLAIGSGGQNARLAAKLTGWKIDIKSETAIAEG